MKKFSVVLATYTGVKTVARTLDSILAQQSVKSDYEVVVVIDGPHKALRRTIDAKRKEFQNRGIPFTIKQLVKNQGRFEARIAGARLAKYGQLLFVDDRVQLSSDYFRVLQTINKDIAMANVQEFPGKKISVVSQTMFFIRRRLYGNKFGKDFDDYNINSSNFEVSPKGTASLWMGKKIFLDVCMEVTRSRKHSNKYVNEDTKILRAVVNRGYDIYRSSKLVVFYRPRANLTDAMKHLYERGPRFVDYYSRPGTRFFPILISIYLITASLIAAAILEPKILFWILSGIIILIVLSSLAISRNPKEFVVAVFGLTLIGLSFSLGTIKGSFHKLINV